MFHLFAQVFFEVMVCSLDGDKERLSFKEAWYPCLVLFKGCRISCPLHLFLIFLDGIFVYYMLKFYLRKIIMLAFK